MRSSIAFLLGGLLGVGGGFALGIFVYPYPVPESNVVPSTKVSQLKYVDLGRLKPLPAARTIPCPPA